MSIWKILLYLPQHPSTMYVVKYKKAAIKKKNIHVRGTDEKNVFCKCV